jgi:hypothetical protein
MAISKEQLLKIGMVAVGGIIAYKIFFEDTPVVEAVKETIIDIPADVVNKTTEVVEKSYFKLKKAIRI